MNCGLFVKEQTLIIRFFCRLIVKTLFCLLTLCVCGGLCALLLVDVINHQSFNKDLETIDIAGMVAAAIEAGEKRKSCFPIT